MLGHDALAVQIAEYYDDPLSYVLDCYPWGEGELQFPVGDAKRTGPDAWQVEFLTELGNQVKARKFDGHTPVDPVRMAVSSGHDTGKTTLLAWVACWIRDTREDSIGTVTANTFQQLETKTWAAIKKWTRLAVTREWWEVGSTSMYHRGRRETWFLACQSSSEENSESFAGQHAVFSSSYYIFDEASAIPKVIWEVASGGLKDGEPFMFAFGNPTRNTGEFYEVCFGNRVHRWSKLVIDSRQSSISNKEAIEEELQDYGEDSDFFRVRVRGLPPNASETQLIPRDLVREAMKRKVDPLDDDPLVCGVDVPDGGSAWFIVRFRRGLDGNAALPIRIAGSKCDRQLMISKLADILADGVRCKDGQTRKVGAMFIDSAFGSPICERLKALGHEKRVNEINFGGKSPDPHFANMRSYMWAKGVKEWLSRGCLDPADEKMLVDLTGPGFHPNRQNAIVIEAKQEMARRGVPSPDDGDALALTFARPVAPEPKVIPRPQLHRSYAPFG